MIIRGELDYMVEPPPTDLLPEIRSKYPDRYEEHSIANTFYFFLNQRVPPFDRRAVRQAVNYALDSSALARLFGGLLEPTCNFLPASIAGYEQIDPCPYGDPSEPADLDRARRLIEEAGATGAEITFWTFTGQPGEPIGAYAQDLLKRIGLDAKLKAVDYAVYPQTVGNQRTRAPIGFASWAQDFPHPANFLYLVAGDTIQPTNNVNLGNVDDPKLDRFIDEVRTRPADEAAAQAAAADRLLVEQAYVAPYGSSQRTTFLSERMDFDDCSRFHPVYGNDYSSFCLK